MRKPRSKSVETKKARKAASPPAEGLAETRKGAGREESLSATGNDKVQGSGKVQDLFDIWDSKDFQPADFAIPGGFASLESRVGYSSLTRHFLRAYRKRVEFYLSQPGGALSLEEAREAAFHSALDKDEAKEKFYAMLKRRVEALDFYDLGELWGTAPQVAERFWEMVKKEGKKEFESGHLAANITFPAGYMKEVWNIARYMGVRESFIAEWKPKGGIEVAMIDTLAQSYFQWQYWLEQTVKRSEVTEKEEHPEYTRWKQDRAKYGQASPHDLRWIRPFVSDVVAVEHAVQMADRFNRIFMRTLRQLRDLRRYAPVTINNANQVNIAAGRGKQTNLANKS